MIVERFFPKRLRINLAPSITLVRISRLLLFTFKIQFNIMIPVPDPVLFLFIHMSRREYVLFKIASQSLVECFKIFVHHIYLFCFSPLLIVVYFED